MPKILTQPQHNNIRSQKAHNKRTPLYRKKKSTTELFSGFVHTYKRLKPIFNLFTVTGIFSFIYHYWAYIIKQVSF